MENLITVIVNYCSHSTHDVNGSTGLHASCVSDNQCLGFISENVLHLGITELKQLHRYCFFNKSLTFIRSYLV